MRISINFVRAPWIVLSLLVVGCQQPPGVSNDSLSRSNETTCWFEEVTGAVGLDFLHDPGAVGDFFMPRSLGSGAAFFDYDNDGRLDVYLLQNAGADSESSNRLFRQTADRTFHDVSAGSGLNVAGLGMGVIAGDVNNDGWTDVFLTEYRKCRLFLNRQNGRFDEVTDQAGIHNPHWGTSASFLDFDRDGWLDIVVANYVDYTPTHKCYDQSGKLKYCGPSGFPPAISRLFRNLGRKEGVPEASVEFSDETLSTGLASVPGPGLGVVCADFDGDRWPDILIADDGSNNRLWINQRDGTFKEEAQVRGIAYNAMGQTQANMGIALGDVDGDRLFDIFVTHLNTETHALWKQEPRGIFQDKTAVSRVARTKWRGTAFGTVMADFDHDAALDLAIVNGGIEPVAASNVPFYEDLGPHWSAYAERDQLLSNDGTGRFTDVSRENPTFCGIPAVGRGLAYADYDDDGAVDLLVTNIGSRAKLFRNVAKKKGHWLIVRAIDPELGGRDAFGSEITVEADGWRSNRWLNPASSYLCSNDPRCHFGLGQHGRIDRLVIVWPDGSSEAFLDVDADQSIVVEKGNGDQQLAATDGPDT